VSAPPSGYSPAVQSLFRSLERSGDLPQATGAAVTGEAVALDRLAWVRFAARVDAGRIVDCRFRAFGCPHTLAAASMAASRLCGAPVDAAPELDAAMLSRALAAPAEKRGRFLVVEDALRDLLAGARRVQ
jgi:NifU-like protein involved in Fe-S cluster formation